MEFVAASVLFLGLHFLLGIGPALWICPRFLRWEAWVLAPWIGYAWVALVGWYGYRLELPGVRSYVGWILAPPLVAGLAWLVKVRAWRWRRPAVRRDVVIPLVIAVLIFLVISTPFLARRGGPTVLSMWNADAADTDTLAGFLRNFARSDGIGLLGQSSHYLRYLADTMVFAGPMSIATASVVLSVETWQLESVSTVVFFVLGAIVLFRLARRGYDYSAPGAAAVMALYGLSSIMYFLVYQTYQAQVIAMGLTLATVLVLFAAWKSADSWGGWLRCAPVLALLSWGVATTYPHMVLLALLPLLAGGVAVAWVEGRWKRLSVWGGIVLLGLAGVVALYPPRGIALVPMLVARSREAAGWFVPWLSPDTVVGLTLGQTDLSPHRPALRVILSLAVLAVLAWGWRRTAPSEPRVLALAATVAAAVVAGYVLLCFTGRGEQGWGGYKSFKLLSFFLPFLLLAALLLFRDLRWRRPRVAAEAAAFACLALLLTANLSSSHFMVRRLETSRVEVTRDMADLARLADDPRIASVNILGDDWWQILWEARFLMTKTLYFETSTYSGRHASELKGEWDLIRRDNHESASTPPVEGEGRHDVIPVNSSYLLRRHVPTEPTPWPPFGVKS